MKLNNFNIIKMEQKLFEELCKLYDYDIDNKIITYKITFQNTNLFKELLFKFCFLLKEGSLKFEGISDLWFKKKSKNQAEINLYLGIIESLIKKSNDQYCELKEMFINLTIDFLNIVNRDEFEIFRYLQSIYSTFEDNPEYIFFPLYYSILIKHSINLDNLKHDLQDIISRKIETFQYNDSINYNINKVFLKYFNMLLISKKENTKEIYDYLCNFGIKKLEFNNIDNNEYFNYFESIKKPILSCEKKLKEKKPISENNINNKEKSLLNKDKNGSTRNSSEDLNNNGSDKKKLVDNIIDKKVEDSFQQKNSEDENIKLFSLSIQTFLLHDLCSRIDTIIEKLNINKNSLDKYKELLLLKYDNALLINKLSSTVLLLQNANTINIRRKLVESLFFAILEKYSKDLEFVPDYFPSKTNLNNLAEIILKIREKCTNENEKKKTEEDFNKIKAIIQSPIESKIDSIISVKNIKSIKLKEQLKMSLSFLRFCKKNLHPFVHVSGEKINLYLLPKSLFKSDIDYAKYIFTLGRIMKSQKENKKEIKNEKDKLIIDNNLGIYKQNKEITIDEALEVLINGKSVCLSYLKNNDVDILKDKKEMLNQKLKILDKYYNSFIQISPGKNNTKFVITDEIKKNESDLIEKLNYYDSMLSEIIKDTMGRTEAINIINEMIESITNEVEDARQYIFKLSKMQFNKNNAYQIINSKTDRLQILVKFVKEQSDKFYNSQTNLYKEYEESCNEIIRKSEFIKEIIKKNSILEKDNLIEQYLKSDIEFRDQYKKPDVIIDNLKALVSNVKLDINYSYDEKFVLWAIMNKYSNYLKN